MSNDKVTSARNGMGQMAMYLYQAFRDEGLGEADAKSKVADEVEKLFNSYCGQAGLDREIPKNALAQAEDILITVEGIVHPTMNIMKSVLANKLTNLILTIKKG